MIGSRPTLMSGKPRLKANMVEALSLAAIVDRLTRIMSKFPLGVDGV